MNSKNTIADKKHTRKLRILLN